MAVPMTLRALASRASRRASWLALERSLLRETTRGLAAAVVTLLGAAAILAVVRPVAPLGDQARTVALAVGAALVASSVALGAKRGLERRTTHLEAAFALDRSLRLDGALPAALELEDDLRPFARLAVAATLERARGADLARAVPRTPPPESGAAPWLALATLALAFLVASRHAPTEPLPRPMTVPHRPASERRDLAEAAAVLSTAAVALAPFAHDAEGELGATGPASAALEELDGLARRWARGTTTATGALGGIAQARGRIESTRAEGLAAALEAAGSALAEAPASAGLARALAEGDGRAIRDKGRALAEQLRSGALTEDARAQVATAAERAARALEGAGQSSEARSALENFGRALDQAKSPDEQAQAATDAADSLAKARAQAAADQVAQRALDALDEARDAARGQRRPDDSSKPGEGGRANGQPRAGEKAPPSVGDSLAKKSASSRGPGRDGNAGGSEKREGSQPGSGSGADDRAGKRGDPAGSGLGSHVAGKGGTNEEEAPGGEKAENADEPGGATSTLAGLLGSRGASAIFAVRGLARGEAHEPRQQDVLQDYRRTEEAALEHELVPVDRRRLVRRYFETIGRESLR